MTDVTDNALAGRLRWIIEYRGFGSARALSLAAGLSHSYVSLMIRGERGKKTLDDAVAEAIAKAGRVPVAWLKAGVGSPNEAAQNPTPVPGSGVYPRRAQAIGILAEIEAKAKDPLLSAAIAGLQWERPETDLTLEQWLARAREIEAIVREHDARRKTS